VWTLPSLWTQRTRPQVTWKTAKSAVFHSVHTDHSFLEEEKRNEEELHVCQSDCLNRGVHPIVVCLDTCHLHAAGYDLRSADGYAETFEQFDRLIGMARLKLLHLNDSKRPLGSRVDRHEHIGEGHLGLEPFRRLVNDARFRALPMLLETPKTEVRAPSVIAVDPLDARNLKTLRGLIATSNA